MNGHCDYFAIAFFILIYIYTKAHLMLSAKFRRNTPCGSREKVNLIGFANLLTAASLNSQSGCFFFFIPKPSVLCCL